MGSASASKNHSPATKPVQRDHSPELVESLSVDPNPSPSTSPMNAIDGEDENEALKTAAFLSREEVLRRRSRRVKQLEGYYKGQYWALMEELKVRHRDYYWHYGKSPFEVEEAENGGDEAAMMAAGSGTVGEGSEEGGTTGARGLGLGFGAGEGRKKGEREKCGFSGCKAYAMPLTKFCHSHILSDVKQTLYKACSYVIKSAHSGQIVCGKPVLRAAVPSLCPVHFQKAQKHVLLALKKAGLNVSSSSNRPAPKFHVIIAEYVLQIQAKRREALNAANETVTNKDEDIS